MDAAASDVRHVEVGGHRVRVTSPAKVLYPGTGTTKWDVVGYVREVAEVLLRHAGQRAVTRKRWPGGVGTLEHPGESFFTKNLERGAPDWVATVVIEHADHPVTYPVLSEEASEPERVVSGLSKAKRAGKVLIDWSQNAATKTTVSPYSLRGRIRPTVAAPRTWEEIEAAGEGGLVQLTYPDVLRRLDRDGDLLAPLAGT